MTSTTKNSAMDDDDDVSSSSDEAAAATPEQLGALRRRIGALEQRSRRQRAWLWSRASA